MTTPAVVEVQGQLKKSGQVTLDANGNGTVTFQPDSAWQRWVISGVVVYTSQDATATVVPMASTAINGTDLTQVSPGNIMGQSWSGNQDTFQGETDVGPCDFFAVMFTCPPGQDPTTLAGVVATAIITGDKFTRRG